MDYTFLDHHREYEWLLFVLAAPLYVAIMFATQSHYLRILRWVLRAGRVPLNEKQRTSLQKVTKAKVRSLQKTWYSVMLIIPVLHMAVYWLTEEEPLRSGYFITIGVEYLMFGLLMMVNFWLKGTTTLPMQQGPVSGV